MKTPLILLSAFFTLLMISQCKSDPKKEKVEEEMKMEEMTEETMQEPTKSATFVLVHSTWLGAWQLGHVTPILEKAGAKVIAPDLPGHGTDKTAPKDITMDNYVNTLLAILDQQTEPVILVGHSFNGITVSRVAELRPDKVKKLVFYHRFFVAQWRFFLQSC